MLTASFCSTFTRAPVNQWQFPSREKGCDLQYLTKAPEGGKRYTVLGECKGKGMKGLIISEYEAAHKRVEDCACKNGGNAIILTKSYTQGGHDQYGQYMQHNAVVLATVIYIEE